MLGGDAAPVEDGVRSQHWHELIYNCNSSPTEACALIWTCGICTLAPRYIQTKINETLQNLHTVDIG